MTILAYWLRSWWKLQLAFAIFSLFLVLYYFWVPESPRWLIEKGRTKEAKAVLLRIAAINRTNIQQTDFLLHFEELERRMLHQEETKGSENKRLYICLLYTSDAADE